MSRRTILAAAVLVAAPVLDALPAAAQGPRPTTLPAAGPVPALATPQPVRRALANGLEVLYVRQAEVPVVSAVLVTRGGTADEPASHPGLAAFTATMLDEGAAGKTALQVADELERLGASLDVSSGWDAATTTLFVLRKNLSAALQLMADVVARPDFAENEVARLREERLTNLRRAVDQPGTIAQNAFASLVFPGAHPYGRFATLAATQATDRAALAAFHRAHFVPRGATLILAGDVDPAETHALVERAFGGWAPADAPAVTVPAASVPAARVVHLVDKPGAAQSEIRIGHPAVARSNPDYFPLMVMNTILGGMFGSRLNTNLREVHGYAYGAGSGLWMRRAPGPFVAQAAVQTNKTDSALVEFFREIERIRDEPVPAEELETAKRFLALSLPATLETAPQVAGSLATLVTFGVPTDFFATYTGRVMAVTAEDVRRVARQYLHPGRAVVVVVGDRAQVEAGIRALNLGALQVHDASEFTR
jgi:zinc protease